MWPAIPLYLPYALSVHAEHTHPQLGATHAVQGPATASVGFLRQINPICIIFPTCWSVTVTQQLFPVF